MSIVWGVFLSFWEGLNMKSDVYPLSKPIWSNLGRQNALKIATNARFRGNYPPLLPRYLGTHQNLITNRINNPLFSQKSTNK